MEEILSLKNVTKDYKNNRGLFDVSFDIKKHEFCGIIGENGAGKTTLMRTIMGFISLDKGDIFVDSLDVKKNNLDIKNKIAYVPGEINYPDLSNGKIFLDLQKELDDSFKKEKANEYIKKFQLDIRANPRKMSKGMKEKLALITALSKDKDIYLLDEATTGLDPLMREVFIEVLLEKKKEGKTLLMSSNNFEEIERVCDRVIYLSSGKVVLDLNIKEILNKDLMVFTIILEDINKFSRENSYFEILNFDTAENEITFLIEVSKIPIFIDKISKLSVLSLQEHEFSLEEYINLKMRS